MDWEPNATLSPVVAWNLSYSGLCTMRILVLDPDRVGLDFCLRSAAAGHEVRWHRFCKKPCKDGFGFKQIEIIDDYKASISWSKHGLIFVTGNTKWIAEMDRLRNFGFPVFAPSVRSSELEIKRSLGMEALEKLGGPVTLNEVTFSAHIVLA